MVDGYDILLKTVLKCNVNRGEIYSPFYFTYEKDILSNVLVSKSYSPSLGFIVGIFVAVLSFATLSCFNGH